MNIHSCSYYCENAQCIKQQRDELRDKLFAEYEKKERVKMGALESIYADAREYAEGERRVAQEGVMQLDIPALRREYIDLMAMVAYYTRIEQAMSATPRLHFDALRKAMTDIKADEMLRQADVAAEDGMPIAGTARVPAKPLLEILSRLKAMLSDRQ
jgi:hypothetical protein